MEGQDVEIAKSEASTVCTLHIRHLFKGVQSLFSARAQSAHHAVICTCGGWVLSMCVLHL